MIDAVKTCVRCQCHVAVSTRFPTGEDMQLASAELDSFGALNGHHRLGLKVSGVSGIDLKHVQCEVSVECLGSRILLLFKGTSTEHCSWQFLQEFFLYRVLTLCGRPNPLVAVAGFSSTEFSRVL